jgi:hypothetical protein
LGLLARAGVVIPLRSAAAINIELVVFI